MMSDQVSTEIGEPDRPLNGLKLLLVEDEALVAMELEDLIIRLDELAEVLLAIPPVAEGRAFLREEGR